MPSDRTYTAFDGAKLVASGDLPTLLQGARSHLDDHPQSLLLIFEDSTGRQVDYDFRGTVEDVLRRYAPAEAAEKLVGEPPEEPPKAPTKGPGRPKLGVVSREVTLLPRHWEWLAEQPSGASATLRRLVDEARQNEDAAVRSKRAAGRVMTALAGDRPNFEEAYRALDTGDRHRFGSLTEGWPQDVRGYLLELAGAAFE